MIFIVRLLSGGRRRWGFRLSILQVMVLVALFAVAIASKVHGDRRFREFRVARARPYLVQAADTYRLEARLLAEARSKTGNEARFLKHDATYARIRAEGEETIAAAILVGTGIDPASLLNPQRPAAGENR